MLDKRTKHETDVQPQPGHQMELPFPFERSRSIYSDTVDLGILGTRRLYRDWVCRCVGVGTLSLGVLQGNQEENHYLGGFL